jgi:vitamin B12 transporter
MKSAIHGARHSVLFLGLCAVFSAHGQTAATPVLKEVLVSAHRVAQPLADIVADVTVIDRGQIERSGAAGVADVLSRVAGFEMMRNGGPGTTTNLFIRGAETRYTAVYIDGVRVDSQSTGGASWEGIPLSQIERIEILRGPAGAVYGSNAMGGVVQLFTRKGEGSFAPYVTLGLGTYATSKLEAGFTGSSGDWDYGLGLADDYSRGFHAHVAPGYNGDDDGYHSQAGSLRLGLELDSRNRLEASLLANDMHSQYDSSNKLPASRLDDQNLRLLQTTNARWLARWSDAYSTTLSVSDTLDRYQTTPSVYQTTTLLRGYLFQNELRLGHNLLTAALERNEDRLNNGDTTPKDSSRSQDGLALGYGWTNPVHAVQINVRQDQDSEFGGQTTGSMSYGYELQAGWRATASAGTAFRAPTLFQRFSSYGSTSLQPEKSRNLELGLLYAQGATTAGMTVYRNNVSNLITFVNGNGPCFSGRPGAPSPACYANTAEAVYQGITFTAEQRWGAYKLHGSLDLQDPRDAVTGKLLPRRSTHHASAGVDTRWGDWALGADLQLSALRYDEAANTTVLPGYVLLGLSAENRVRKDWTVIARVDNATDAAYQLVNTYATPGRSLYVGLKWAP